MSVMYVHIFPGGMMFIKKCVVIMAIGFCISVGFGSVVSVVPENVSHGGNSREREDSDALDDLLGDLTKFWVATSGDEYCKEICKFLENAHPEDCKKALKKAKKDVELMRFATDDAARYVKNFLLCFSSF